MRNTYLRNLNKIEFILTYACTGRCKHCSEGDHPSDGERIDPDAAAEAVKRIAAEYGIRTVMTFGGEPLLHTDAVVKIMTAARESGVPHRQLITNGYLSKNPDRQREVAAMLSECGVNDLLLSVDAFHQQTIPQDAVLNFARELVLSGVPTRLSPAWLVSHDHDNEYNRKTRAILGAFSEIGIPVGCGNVVFPEGNAVKFLGEYFGENIPENPYTEDPCNVKCISFEPNGDVLGENFYRRDILDIINSYAPQGR